MLWMSVRSEITGFARGNILGRRGVREIALIGALYLFYCVTRTFAEDDLGPAQDRALDLHHLERVLRINMEHPLNNWFVAHAWAAVPACYWYAAAHYLVTLAVLVWLYRRGPAHYTPARWALVVASLIALACYLLLPTAPPRMTGGYVDVLSLHSGAGWWGADASAPKGMGGLTNQLAAFPSLHAGWALWVALVVRRNSSHLWLRGLAWVYAVTTALVVIGTGNHWLLDVLVGWALVILAMWLVDPWFADQRAVTRVRIRFRDQLVAIEGRTDSRSDVEIPGDDRIPTSREAAAYRATRPSSDDASGEPGD
jgi:membrane-associated phospholipid phosphatase